MSRRRILLANQSQGGGGFSPLDLSPNLWLDATDATTITEVSGDVSQWDDKSGNGNDVSQSTPANRPANGGTINGNNAIEWDINGVNNLNLGLDRGATTDNWQDVFIVIRWDGGTTFPAPSGVFSAFRNGGTNSGSGLNGEFNRNYFYDLSFGTWWNTIELNCNVLGNNEQVIGVGGDLVNNSMIQITTNSAIGVDGVRIGKDRENNNRGWIGVIGEVAVFPEKLVLANKQKMQGYIAHKWGLTYLLPVSHPYKTVAP